MVKLGVFADTHVGRAIPSTIGEQRRRAFRHAFSRAVDLFIREEVDYLIHAGDVFERRSMTPGDSMFVKEELQRLVDGLGGGVKIFIVRGNHDGTVENSALNYIEHPLARYLRVIGDRTLSGEAELYEDGEVALVGLGYTPYPSMKVQEVKDVVRRCFSSGAHNKIFVAHMFVEGQEVPPGVPGHQVASLDSLRGLGASLVIAGHNHKYKPITESGGARILTPGATEAVDLSDEWPHGACILEPGVGCRFEVLPPLHRIRSVAVDGGDAVRQAGWFVERALGAVKGFSGELGGGGLEGVMRVVLRGVVEGGVFDLEAELERSIRGAREASPLLLHVELVNELREAGEHVSVAEHTTRDEFLRELFAALGEGRAAEALSLAEEVEAALEERGSPQTGLLRESDRRSFVERWLKLLGEG